MAMNETSVFGARILGSSEAIDQHRKYRVSARPGEKLGREPGLQTSRWTALSMRVEVQIFDNVLIGVQALIATTENN